MRPGWFFLLAVGLGLSSVAPVGAQFRPSGAPTNPPPYSPYLNLLRPNTPLYQDYYGLVRPEQEFRSGIQNLQRQQTQTDEELANTTAYLGATGHSTSFMNTRGYFQSRTGGVGAQGQGSSGGGQGTAARFGQGMGASPRP
jgi:hypothetical protein